MKRFYIFSSVCAVFVAWLLGAVLYNEFGHDPNPDGMFKALVGVVFTGPVLAIGLGAYLKKLYKKNRSDPKLLQTYSIIILLGSIAVFMGANYAPT